MWEFATPPTNYPADIRIMAEQGAWVRMQRAAYTEDATIAYPQSPPSSYENKPREHWRPRPNRCFNQKGVKKILREIAAERGWEELEVPDSELLSPMTHKIYKIK